MSTFNFLMIEAFIALAIVYSSLMYIAKKFHLARIVGVCPMCDGSCELSGFSKTIDKIESAIRGVDVYPECYYCDGGGTFSAFDRKMDEISNKGKE